ncbi:hypothetical protein SOMG_04446 [Schizosaccharomyces osmophilus]|uniref:Uncharacterized protein n=1 Tax=Schizosaccharomyces osmophilus TaxID=2545709 RepID=A0AAF0AZH9_9SCHI|nr:uncharacterized protein SOMG_04446 [Schizosaccharomyces osmophilus]WBW75153.1 hypothetical protein SOMG_04446 [Schizosaccharomyces osmophilus]
MKAMKKQRKSFHRPTAGRVCPERTDKDVQENLNSDDEFFIFNDKEWAFHEPVKMSTVEQ